MKGSNLRLALVSSYQIGTVLLDQEERLRIQNEKKWDENMNLDGPNVKSILAAVPLAGLTPLQVVRSLG